MKTPTPPENSSPTPEPHARSFGPARGEQVLLLYRFSLIDYLSTLLVVFTLGAILWDDLSQPRLFTWFVAISLITVGRYAIYKIFVNRNPAPHDYSRWEQLFLFGALLTALAWAVLALWLLPDSAHLGQRLTTVMLVTLLITGAVGYSAPHPYAFKIAAIVGLVPFALMLGLSGERNQLLLSGALLLLAGVLPSVHERLHRALVETLAVRREKAFLTNELDSERTRLQQANDSLAEEMVARLKSQQAELMAAQKLRMHAERTPLAVIEWDRERRVSAWNPSAEAIFGFSQQEAMGRRAVDFILSLDHSADFDAMWDKLAETLDGTKISLENVTSTGRTIHCEWYNTPLVDQGGRVVGFASLVQDVTERLDTERTIHYMAHHDALTGLPNRRLMQDRLNQAIMKARRLKNHVAVLFLDLDRFKVLNDTLGHDAGDFVLKDVARRLTSCVREADTVSREGGDEFVVILPDLERPEYARVVANNILLEFAKPMEYAGHEIYIATSIGISNFPNDAADVNHLLKNADSAMYLAKDAGRNTVRFFSKDLNFLLAQRFEIEGKLRRGIARDEFFLRYQPQVDIATGRIVGMEALLRWNNPEKGEVLPAEFISAAEELGLIVPIGAWVFRAACLELKAWQDKGIKDVVVSVNLSPRQFMSRKFVSSLLEIVRETGADARRVVLEITESMAIRNLEQSIELLGQLCAAGISVSIDDFGIGYSSLGQLNRLPASTLKIDQSFIENVRTEASSGSITIAIIALAKSLNLRVVAEGVETPEQLSFLREHACDTYQGYLFSRPLLANEAIAMLEAQARQDSAGSSPAH